MTDVPLRCSCGHLKGTARKVSPEQGNHCVCYCTDCQAFARFLGRQDEILDDHGGTEIFQMSAGQIEFHEGTEHLALMRLSPKGLNRWYASCCNTPVANTLASSRLPFAGIIRPYFALGGDQDEQTTFGPVLSAVHGRFAYGNTDGLNLHPRAPASLILRFLRMAAKWKFQGAAKRSPFHDHQPVARVLSKQEREQFSTPPTAEKSS